MSTKTRGKSRRRLSMAQKRSFEALIFLAPWLIGLCLFFLRPIGISLRLAFSEIVKMKGFEMGWVGLKNFEQIFFYDINFVPMFLSTITDTLLNTPICLVFSLVIAILLNRKMVGRGFFRAAFFIPVLLGTGYVMKQMLGMGADGTTITTGIMVPQLISDLLGHQLTDFLQTVLDRITVVLWKSGVQIVLFLAGLQGISSSLYEAARVDGCGPIRTYTHIMLPMSQSSLLVCMVLSLVWHWNDYFEPGVYITSVWLKMLPNRLPSLYAELSKEQHTMIQKNDIEGLMFNEAMLMAATFLCILPILIMYLILQRHFMEGVERSGLTGT